MEVEMYKIHEFTGWPFRMVIMQNELDLIGIDRSAYSTSDTYQATCKRPDNIKQYALIDQLVQRANRYEAAEREAAELSAANATLEQRVRELTAERDALQRAMRDYMSDMFAHTAPPTDWDQETPFGQMIDGNGDEVEP